MVNWGFVHLFLKKIPAVASVCGEQHKTCSRIKGNVLQPLAFPGRL